MKYKDALYDGSDPSYAPGLMWVKQSYPRWQPPKKYRDAGCPVQGQKLPGRRDDGQDNDRAAMCRDLTRQMLEWWNGREPSTIEPGTWAEIIARYEADEFSTLQGVKENTRKEYLEQSHLWGRIIGHMKIGQLDYTQTMKIIRAMQAKGRSAAYISRAMGQLRRLAKYGSLIQAPGIVPVRQMLSDIRVATPASRSVLITRDQVQKMVLELELRGQHVLALGYLMQFEYILRAVDLRGQWLDILPGDDQTAGIVHDGKRWQDGLTWDMIDPDFTTMTKVISKTAKSLPEPYVFDLTAIPEVQDRLKALHKTSSGVGPVFLAPRGLPYSQYSWSQAFRRVRDDLITAGYDIPADVTSMDLRAGGATEAKHVVKDPFLIRDAAQHKKVSTTDGYVRDRSAGAAQVVRLRQGK